MAGLPGNVRRALVVGASRSGKAAARALIGEGVEVVLSDSKPEAELPDIHELRIPGVELRMGTQAPELLEGVDLVVKSPGVPGDIGLVDTARGMGVPVWSEIELAYRLLDNDFDAVTGTNGKTTTTALLGHVFRVAGRPVHVLGNIGIAASAAVGSVGPEDELVVEVSSFQLEDTDEFRPRAGIFLNLTPDHLDRHGTMAAYRAAKERLFAAQTPDDCAVLNVDDPVGSELADALRLKKGGPRVLTFSVRRPGRADSWMDGENLYLLGRRLVSSAELSIRGAHNMENALAAATAAWFRGVPPQVIRNGLVTFAGVEHRLQLAGTIAGIAYVNDSKATNVEATLKALDAYPRGVHLILGGRDKGADYRPVAHACADGCVAVYLIGEAADLIRGAFAEVRSERIGREGGPEPPPLVDAGDLETAIAMASRRAHEGEVVLLAPACASFDQYRDYEERGRHFMTIVSRMEGGE